MNSIFGTEASPSENTKSFQLPLGPDQEVNFTFKDPYGLLTASTDGCALPTELEGNFTSVSEARKAVNLYMTQNPTGPVKVKTNKKAA